MGETVSYSPLAQEIMKIIEKYCCFPQPILETHCRKLNITPSSLKVADLSELAPRIGKAVELFTNPEKGKRTREEILKLCSW